MPTASIEASPLTENGEVYEIIDYPAQGFALELKSPDDLERVSEHAFKIVHYLYRVRHKNVDLVLGRISLYCTVSFTSPSTSMKWLTMSS